MEKLTVLAIDDEEAILNLINVLLKSNNYNVITAQGGMEALRILDESRPDMILLDIRMDGMSGYEVCRKIREREDLSFIPVIFLTALSSEEDRARAFSLGAVDFITKPINKKILFDVLEKHSATEDRWKSFIQKKVRGGETATLARRSFSTFREFIFEFLGIPEAERNSMKAATISEFYQELGRRQHLEPSQIAILVSLFAGYEYLPDIESKNIIMDVLPPTFSRKNNVITIQQAERFAFVVADPFNFGVLDLLQGMKPLRIFVSPPAVFAALYKSGDQPRTAEEPKTGEQTGENISDLVESIRSLYYTRRGAEAADADPAGDADLLDKTTSPLVRFVNTIIEDAYIMGASDIHIEPQEKSILIRYRIDGELNIINHIEPRELISAIGSRIKIMSNLNIAERRMPQDGRIAFKEFTSKPLDFDLRVSCAPMYYGEKVVMRILDKRRSLMPLESMGFSPRALALYREKIRTPYGMVLHVGPTGSGKSMSLYAALNELNRPNINIQTAEDPIEYTLAGINQMQVNPAIGLTFKEALRSFLRQDPDAILVGEIRDLETAEIAVEAALTGHLLFSTLHTNDAPSTVIRFTEMGIKPYLVSGAIVLICAQRLLRRLCNVCKEEYTPDEIEKRIAGLAPDTAALFYRPVGCPACNNTGYKGRVGIYELLAPNDEMRAVMNSEKISTEIIRRLGREKCGMITLFEDAIEKVREGITSFAEAVAKSKAEEQ